MHPTRSSDVGKLVNFSTNRIHFKDKVPKFSFKFIQWLEKMVEPDPINRFPNAKIALDMLHLLYVVRTPDVMLDKEELTFAANRLGETLNEAIVITNIVPETSLIGRWSINFHPNDPLRTSDHHAWIQITPRQFKAQYNEKTKCYIKINTRNLKADKVYERQIILSSNGKQEKIFLTIKVKTAAIQLKLTLPPYRLIMISGLVLFIVSFILTQLWMLEILPFDNFDQLPPGGGIIIFTIGIIGKAIGGNLGGFLVTGFAVAIPVAESYFWLIAGVTISAIVKSIINKELAQKSSRERKSKLRMLFSYGLLTVITSILAGTSLAIGLNIEILIILIPSAVLLSMGLVYPLVKRQILKIQYRQQESSNLIDQ